MADSTTVLDTITEAQAEKATAANALFDAGSWAITFGRRASETLALTWAWYGGRVGGTSVANGSVALTASATTFLVVHRTTLAVSAATKGDNWCTPEIYARLYRIVCSSSGVTSYEDHRFGKWGIFEARTADVAAPLEILLQDGTIATALTAATGKASRRTTSRGLLTSARAAVATVSSSGNPAFDVNADAVSIFATTPTIDANEKTSVTAATPYTFCEFGDVLDDDQELTLDCDTAGTSAAGASVVLSGIRNCGHRDRDLLAFLLLGQGANNGTTFTDQSPTPKTITRVNQVITSTAIADPWGGSLSSLYFDGTGDVLTIPYSDDVNLTGRCFEVGGWAYNASGSGNHTLMDFRGGANSASAGWVIFISGSSRYIAIYHGPTNTVVLQSANNAIPAVNNWWQWKVSRDDAGVVRILVGTTGAAATVVQSATYAPPATHSTGIRFGLDTVSGDGWNGYMRDLYILPFIARRTAGYTPARKTHPVY